MVDFPIQVKVDPGNAEAGLSKVEDRLEKLLESSKVMNETLAKGFEASGKHAEEAGEHAESFGHKLKEVAEALALVEVGHIFLEFAEEAEAAERKLELVTNGTEELGNTQSRLVEVAKQTHVAYSDTVDTYEKLALATKELGINSAQLLNFQSNLQQTITATGASAETAREAMTALTRSFSNGVVDGRALRIILAEIPTAADQIAEHLNVTRSGLKVLGDAGKISAKDLFDSFDSISEKTKELSEKTPTLSQAYTDLKTSFVEFVGGIDKSFSVLEKLSHLTLSARDAVEELNAQLHPNDLEISVEEEGHKYASIGEYIVNITKAIKANKAAGADPEYIHTLEDQLQGFKNLAKGISDKGKEDVIAAAKSDEHADALKRLNAERERGKLAIEQITKKQDDELAIANLQLTASRADVELRQLLNPLLEKQKGVKAEINTEDYTAAKRKQELLDLNKDEAKFYQEIIGPQRQYLETQEALNKLVKDHTHHDDETNTDQTEPGIAEAAQRDLTKAKIAADESSTDFGAGFERAFLKLKLEAQDFAAVAEKSVNAFADDATSAILTFVQTGKFSFASFADAIIADLEKILVRALVVQAITGISGGLGLGASSTLAGAHADGGTEQGGLPYLVGEKGPEIHRPGVTGSTQPLVLGGGAPQVNVKVVNVSDPKEISQHIDDGNADQAILNVLNRNNSKVRQIVGH